MQLIGTARFQFGQRVNPGSDRHRPGTDRAGTLHIRGSIADDPDPVGLDDLSQVVAGGGMGQPGDVVPIEMPVAVTAEEKVMVNGKVLELQAGADFKVSRQKSQRHVLPLAEFLQELQNSRQDAAVFGGQGTGEMLEIGLQKSLPAGVIHLQSMKGEQVRGDGPVGPASRGNVLVGTGYREHLRQSFLHGMLPGPPGIQERAINVKQADGFHGIQKSVCSDTFFGGGPAHGHRVPFHLPGWPSLWQNSSLRQGLRKRWPRRILQQVCLGEQVQMKCVRRSFLVLGWLGVLALSARASHAAERPNVLFLFADDLSYEALHYAGNHEVLTPNLDRLASQGTQFTHCYNMGGWNGAVCIASRTMLNTGRFLWNAPQTRPQLEEQQQASRFWAQYMRHAGYRTFMTGKWHLVIDAGKVFETTVHVRPGMPPTVPQAYHRPPADGPDPWSPFDRSLGGYWEGGRHWSEVTADDAIAYLHQAQKDPAPFFMYVAFNAPHDPRQAPEEFVNKYPVEGVQIPASFLPDYPHRDGMGLTDLRDENLAPHPRTPHAVQVHRREYYALITHLDEQIGRVLDALDQSGKRDNTWIFFTADHGLAVGHHGLMGKQSMYDHSVRAPFLVVGPGVAAQARIDTPIYLQDVMPTTLELAGISPPSQVQFRSLLPCLRGDKTPVHDAIYGAYIDFQRMVTADGYKLILYPKLAVARLYHLADDPDERHDLLGPSPSSGHLATARMLFQKLLNLQKETGDTLDLITVYPQLGSG